MAIKEVTEYRVTVHGEEGFLDAGVFGSIEKANAYTAEQTALGFTTKLYIETSIEDDVDWAEIKRDKIRWDTRFDDMPEYDED